IVVLYGDTNSTLAGALAASKSNKTVAHIEAGLRSFNKEMPEEINRVITDHVSNYLFCPNERAKKNLIKEGITEGVHVVGDIMKDMLMYSKKNNKIIKPIESNETYYYVTLHRPYNVDDCQRLKYIFNSLNLLDHKVIFAVHPRTKKSMINFEINEIEYKNIQFIEPQPYFENLGYIYYSEVLITDSGGMQKEAYWLAKRCITLRTETEWTETLENNANILMFNNLGELNIKTKGGHIAFDQNLYGNGMTCYEIVNILSQSNIN
ncbi:MAG: UDP-N-acetylglucosamine 2-epimerase, partial [Bacteroidota bacterium]